MFKPPGALAAPLCALAAAGAVYFISLGGSAPTVFALLMTGGLALFGVRRANFLAYGWLELAMAVLALGDVALRINGGAGLNEDLRSLQWHELVLQTGGAMFVLVRSLEGLAGARKGPAEAR